MESPESFGRFLEAIRGEMSLREAAEKSGLSHTYIRNLELGKSSTNRTVKASPETLRKLADAYNYPYSMLMYKAGYLDEAQYVFDFDDVDNPIRKQTDEEAIFDYVQGHNLFLNDLEKILFDNDYISFRGERLSLDDKQRIIDMLPILLKK